jgi:hypothetical protein
MDLAALVADRPLLAQLSAEYEALKRRAAGEPLDYSAWIRERLRAAAAAKVTAQRAGRDGGCGGHGGGGGPGALDGVQRLRAAACAQQRLAYRTRLRQQQRVAAAAAALAEEDSAAGGGAAPGACGWQARRKLGRHTWDAFSAHAGAPASAPAIAFPSR